MNQDQAGSDLSRLARQAGILEHWIDAHDRPQRVAPETLRAMLAGLGLPAQARGQVRQASQWLAQRQAHGPAALSVTQAGAALTVPGLQGGHAYWHDEQGSVATARITPGTDGRAGVVLAPDTPGYYTLECGATMQRVAVAPADCAAGGGPAGRARLWGIAAQVYSLRASNHPLADGAGLGDFAALRELAQWAGGQGASALAISPVHAMFSAAPEQASPYMPSNRRFLNVLYACPAHELPAGVLAQLWEASGLREKARQLEAAAHLDWPQAARLRLALLRRVHTHLSSGAAPAAWQAFEQYRQEAGADLRNHAVYEAIHAHLAAHGQAAADWRQWEPGLRDPASAQVADFARAHASDVQFHALAQWLAARGLRDTQQAARQAGMPIGLLADLAVGAAPGGSETWGDQDAYLRQLSIGAPPDIHNPAGQGWGLAAFSPMALRDTGYAAFLALIRAVLRDTGGLRIDHILGLCRLWLVPHGAHAADGAYLAYPMQDMLRLIALEAWRHGALVIGENLGTVPPGFNQQLHAGGVLGTSVLWFEREPAPDPDTPAPFHAPAAWSGHAIAMPTTHDLPTLSGWWQGHDIAWRARLGLLGADQTASSLQAARLDDRQALWAALCQENPGPAPQAAPIEAILAFIARTPAPLALVPMEDLLALREQPNLPGTLHQHPNWCQRLPAGPAQFDQFPTIASGIRALARERGAA